MRPVDFTFYQETFRGKLDEDTFNRLAVYASAYLDNITQARVLIATQFERLCQPYVPMSAESGAHFATRSQVSQDGKTVTYPGPYAHYDYVGEVYGPNIPIMHGGIPAGFFSPPGRKKSPTGREMEFHGAPMRGKEWDKRMIKDFVSSLTEVIPDVLNTGVEIVI